VSVTADPEIKHQVRQFYDQVGWQRVGDCCYQNARYEDLRPVSREYIHRCHMRVLRHLAPGGSFMLDAGSGPIQYPEYLEYSKGYKYRVCADISYVALEEARARIGDHGLYVVADVANLPFEAEVFEGVTSLHTIHHLLVKDQISAYQEIYRVLAASCVAVIVNGWRESVIMSAFNPLIRLAKRLLAFYRKVSGRSRVRFEHDVSSDTYEKGDPKGTYVHRQNSSWLTGEIGTLMPVEILVWRSVSTRFLRTLIHRRLGGRWVLKVLCWLEECAPHFFGLYGQYPLIVIRKP